jgi:uncharacterized membrane protein YphA (DoxX/SURF4 family)
VVAVVALRLALGCHFLYEGVWKINHSDFRHDEMWKSDMWRLDGDRSEAFTARPFLALAKGPVSGLFYAMLPDIDGRQRLKVVADKDDPTKKSIDSRPIVDCWAETRGDFVKFYAPPDAGARIELEKAAEEVYQRFVKNLDAYLKDNVDDIAAYFGSLDRFENDPERSQDAPFQKERRWNQMLALRSEADKWVRDVSDQQRAYASELYSLLDNPKCADQKQRGLMTATWKPWEWDRMKQINVAVTLALTAIGLCLMAGFFTRLAALGGAAFMCFVVLTQPAFPTIFPHDPPIVGHALLVNKDFVEMIALLVVAALPAGRWGGLDFFVHRWIVQPFLARRKGEIR